MDKAETQLSSSFSPRVQLQRTPPSGSNPPKRVRSNSLQDVRESSALVDDLQGFLSSDFDVREGIRKIIVLLLQSTSQINCRLDQFAGEIAEIRNWRVAVDERIADIDGKQEDLVCEMEGANQQLLGLQEIVDSQSAEMSVLRSDIDALENRQRRENLVFFNVPFENTMETWDQSRRLVLGVCEKLGLSDINIDRAHRTGRNSNSRVAPIVARITSTDQRNVLLSKWKELKELSIGISEDYSISLRQKRRFLNAERKKALAEGKNAKLKFDKLLIDNETFVCNPACNELVRFKTGKL